MTLCFEDFEIGRIERFGRYEVTREEVLEFASRYDPQPFHLDDEAAAESLFGRIAASGWHTCAITMRLMVDHWQATGFGEASMGGAGMDQIRWHRPVYPGDVLCAEAEVLEKTPSRSKPDRGFVKSRWKLYNQKDDAVLELVSTGIFRTRAGMAALA